MGMVNWIKGLGGRTLYYPGCFMRERLKEEVENYKEIFNLLGISYFVIEEMGCSGSTAYNAGYKKEAKKIVLKNFDLLKKNRVSKIITSSAEAYYFFKEVYPSFVRDWDIEVEHAVISILDAIKEEGIEYEGVEREGVAYHDPFYLGRYSGIYEEPREVINLLGGDVLEFKKNRDLASDICSESSYYLNFPEVVKESARKRAERIPDGATKLVVPCGFSYDSLKPYDVRCLEFSTYVLGRLRGILR